jgi:Brp/Blh family beta-carotene 15,15'-monooxygenase
MQLQIRKYLLLFGLLLLIGNYLLPLNVNTQISFLVGVLILFGIPHGALDLYIDQKVNKAENNKWFLFKYLINIVLYALVWYFMPSVALIIFIIITAYHFGEIDWLGKSETVLHKFVYSVLGLSWILFLLSSNMDFAVEVFLNMGKSNTDPAIYFKLAKTIYPISIALLFVVNFILFFFKTYFFESSKDYYFSLIQLAILSLLNIFLPLWICFSFYFGIWHSLLSFDKIRLNFNIPNTFNGWKHLLFKAAPFSIMAWIGILYIIFASYNSKDTSGIFTLLFISLAVLALPHLQVFTKLKFKR